MLRKKSSFHSLLLAALGAVLVVPSFAATTAEAQKAMTPQEAFEALLAGNERFVSGVSKNRDLNAEVTATSTGQFPMGVVLTCLDSRTTPENYFDTGIGDIFVGRIAGNFVDEEMLGSFEFAHKLAGAKILAVVGHTACGAVKGAADGAKLGNLTRTLAELGKAVEAVPASVQPRNSQNPAFVQQVADANVRLTVGEILQQSPILAEMVENGELGVVGGMYDLSTGKVTFFEDALHGVEMPQSM